MLKGISRYLEYVRRGRAYNGLGVLVSAGKRDF
jgi:hypothetical protein